MANLFTNLAVPAGVGVGASVNMTTFGRVRTVTAQGTFVGTITIEVSQDDTNFFPIMSFTGAKKKTVEVAAAYMRVRRSGDISGTANVDVASDDSGGDYIQLVAPAGDGAGAAVNVGAFGTFNTVVVSGVFVGTVHIEISEDNIDWAELKSLSNPGMFSRVFVAQYMRVRRSGTTLVMGPAGTPTIYVGAIRDAGVLAALGWLAATTQKTAAYNAVLNDLVLCDADLGAFNITLPLAAASAIVTPTRNYGGHLAVKEEAGTNQVNVIRSGADTINGALTTMAVPPGGCVIFVSDGVSDWEAVAVSRETMLNQVNDYTADQGSAAIDLVDGANFVTPCATGNYFRLTAAANRVMAAPTGMTAGHTYMWRFLSSGAGRVITFPASFNFPNGSGFTTGSGGAASVDIVTAAYNGTDFDCVGQPNMS